MITVMDLGNNEKMEEKCLEPQLWHACAGGMVQMPKVNTKVFYFPQGHWEHANIKTKPEFGGGRNFFPPLILCRVSSIKYLADSETDEVYAKLRLIPLKTASDYNDCEGDDDDDDNGGLLLGFNDDNISSSNNDCEKPNSFAKTLTQSDANNGGGFSVPRYCADTIFPKLNFKAEPPVQTILAKDVHGEVWKFRHIFRGTPRRHLLTTGWSNFVNQKKLVAGDSIVFLRADNGGDLFVGIRRAKRVGIGIGIGGGGCGLESPSGWNAGGALNNYGSSRYGGLSSLLTVGDGDEISREGLGRRGVGGKVKAESVTEALNLASNGQPFEVIYYPRASTPEFVVKASSINSAMRINWHPGMRFKMPFETEDSSRISWFMGTISSVQVDDPIHWPKSPWRLLQVAWDEPDLLQNVKSVSPWLVEVVSNLPTINLTPFSPPSRKKLRIPQSPEFSFTGHHQQQLTMSSFLSNNPLSPSSPLCCLSDNNNNNYSNIPAGGIQGARHPPQLGLPLTLPLPSSGTSFLYTNKLQQQQHQGQFPLKLKQFSDNHPASLPPPKMQFGKFTGNSSQFRENENVSCVLTMGNSSQELKTTAQTKRRPTFVLFGQPILTEQQISQSSSSSLDENQYKTTTTTTAGGSGSGSGSGSGCPPPPPPEYYYCCADGVLPWYRKDQKNDFVSENSSGSDHCKVFMDSEDVGRTMDLSVLSSFEELYGKLAEMFNLKRSEMLSNVLYQDMAGTTVKRAGEEPFSKFLKSARRINILTDSGSDNIGI